MLHLKSTFEMQLHQLCNNYNYSRDLMYAKHLINVITYSDIKIQIHYTDNNTLYSQ